MSTLETLGSHFTCEFLLLRACINSRVEMDLMKINKPNCPILYCHLQSQDPSLSWSIPGVFLSSPRRCPPQIHQKAPQCQEQCIDFPGHEWSSAPVRNKCETNKMQIKLNKLVLIIDRTRVSSVFMPLHLWSEGRRTYLQMLWNKQTCPMNSRVLDSWPPIASNAPEAFCLVPFDAWVLSTYLEPSVLATSWE